MPVSILDGFEIWTRLKALSVSHLHETLCGVYIFRHNEEIQYPNGNSDILYIGQTGNYRQRLFGNYLGGVGGKTTKRIHRLLFNDNYIEKVIVGFKICTDYKREEKRLRNLFRRQYGKLPVWNLR